MKKIYKRKGCCIVLVIYIVVAPCLVSGEHINKKRIIYSFINAGQSKIYFNSTINTNHVGL